MSRGGWVLLVAGIGLSLGRGGAVHADELPALPHVETLHYRLVIWGTTTEKVVDADNRRARIEIRDQTLPHDANIVSITIRLDDPLNLKRQEYLIDPRNKTITASVVAGHDGAPRASPGYPVARLRSSSFGEASASPPGGDISPKQECRTPPRPRPGLASRRSRGSPAEADESIYDFFTAFYPNGRQRLLDERQKKDGRVAAAGNELIDGINTTRFRWDASESSDSEAWWLIQRDGAWIPFQHASAPNQLDRILDVRFNEPLRDELFAPPAGYANG